MSAEAGDAQPMAGDIAPFETENAAFERWLGTQCDVVADDLAYKRERMARNAFVFLRATFFRWSTVIGNVCGDLADAPPAVAVGDAHVENFGTWRDADGRLIWGVNDFDEAAIIAYAYDLVRLATSVRLYPGSKPSGREATEAILTGYRRGIGHPGPTILDEAALAMRPLANCSDADRFKFWVEVAGYPTGTPTAAAEESLRASLPAGAVINRFATRRKGGGSLGRPRFLAIATWQGGTIVREAKALVPSAWNWALGTPPQPTQFLALAHGRFRAPDPFLDVHGGFVVRRIAADSRKIEFGDGASSDINLKLLDAMGFDLASIHASGADGAAVLQHLNRQPDGWLRTAAKAAEESVQRDFAAFTSNPHAGAP